MLNKSRRSLCVHVVLGLFLFMFHTAFVRAGDLAISRMDVASMGGDKLQIQLEMNGPAIAPKAFHTDNPARIALDFSGVKNALDKKMYPINQGTVNSVYVAEATDRVRVVVNLLESTPFETRVVGNKVLLTLIRAAPVAPPAFIRSAEKSTLPSIKNYAHSNVSALIPEQAISGFDFKRGDKGEGRILVTLANPNTIVNSRQEGGKVIISLLNTRLPENLSKRLDVSEFATPVKFIDATSSSREAIITVTTQNDLYDYSLLQSEGLLTIEFRPLSVAEKEALDRTRTKYTGDRLSLNFQDIEIRNVIAILAEFTGQNVVAGDDVTGAITLKLDDVPWDEALDFIMMTKGLGKYETGNVTLISPLDKIREYKQKQQETEAVVEQLDPLVTEYIKINYAKADDFKNLIYGGSTRTFGSCGVGRLSGSSSTSGGQAASTSGTVSGSGSVSGYGPNAVSGLSQNQIQAQGPGQKSATIKNDQFNLLSSRGSVVVDARTNTLIVRETAKQLEEIKKLIHSLDVPVRQVMIESRVVIATNTFAKELGVRFGVAKTADLGSGKTIAVGGEGTRGDINGGVVVNDMLVDLAASNPYGALGMTLARGADYVLNLEISALQDQGLAELISNPRVMTSDRCQASIKQGVEIPYQSGSSPTTAANIQFKEVVLQLDVLPQITPSGTVLMDLLVSKDFPDPTPPGQVPSINTRSVQTNVLVKDGETVVLGGVFDGTINNLTNSVPFFADLPGIGFLFKRTINQNDKRELLIFVTPKIMKETVANN
ncbi:MAG: type IV pilus secretin PilQ [Methylococcales bacterium]|nr:type IV pilus secretin PilQ [Methylococcales bacterium]